MLTTPATERPSISDILKRTEFSRDALPYSDEFERHYAAFAGADGGTTRQQFWRSLLQRSTRRICDGDRTRSPFAA